MAGKHIKQLSGSQTPQKDVIRIQRSCGYDVSALLNCQTGELSRLVSFQGLEIPVLDEVISSHSAI